MFSSKKFNIALVLLFFIIECNYVSAQIIGNSPTSKFYLDSLQNEFYKSYFIAPKEAYSKGLLLYNTLPAFEHEKRNELLFELGKQLEINQKEKLYEYALFLKSESGKNGQAILEAHSNYFKGVYFHFHENWTMSQQYIKQSLLLYKQLNAKEEVFSLTLLTIQLIINNYEGEIGIYQKEIVRLLNTHPYKTYAYVSNYSNLAHSIFYSKGKLDSVYYYNGLAKSYMDKDDHYNIHHKYIYFINLIEYGLKSGRYEISINAIQEGFKIRNSPLYTYHFFLIYVIQYYLDEHVKDYANAEKYCREIVSQSQFDEYTYQAYKYLAGIYYQKREIDSMRKFTVLGDQFYTSYLKSHTRQSVLVLEKEMQSEALKFKNYKLGNLLKKNEFQTRNLLFFVFGLMIISILLIILITNYIRFNRKLKLESSNLQFLNSKLISEFKNHDKTMFLLRESNDKLKIIAKQVAHDIANPLTAVVFNNQLIQQKLMNRKFDDILEHTREISENCKRAGDLVSEVLETSIIGNKVAAYKVDLNVVLIEVLAMLKIKIEESQSKIYFQRLPIVKGFRSEMMQLFINLITNAIKYKKEYCFLELNINFVEKDRKTFQIQFQDNGKGIQSKKMKTIFELFSTENTLERSYGIGLYTCAQIAKNYNGYIDVESEVGEGSLFIVTMNYIRNQ